MRADLARHMQTGSVVITPNRRLAAYLKRKFDLAQLASGRRVWPTADCLPLSVFYERLYAELTRFSADGMLLTSRQEVALWEEVVRSSPQGSVLLMASAAARAAREAWALQHAYRIDLAKYGPTLDEDGKAYMAWASDFNTRTLRNRWLDAARLPDAIIDLLKKGARVEMHEAAIYGFDQLTPQTRAVFEALSRRGWKITELAPDPRKGNAQRRAHDDRESEFTAVAEEATAALANEPAQRIGVIVPDLGAARNDVLRVFDDIFDASRVLSGRRGRVRPYNVSLGLPLPDYPLVHTAFLILELARGELTLEAMGSLLRSPFLGDAEQELAARALLDSALRSDGRTMVPLRTVARRSHGRNSHDPARSPHLAARLASWIKIASEARKARQPPSQWSVTFQKLLAGLGWPGERSLESDEYQTLQKWREVISSFLVLDPITPQLGFAEALMRLKRFAADTPFQPESPEAPVQVLGVLEANALDFDRLFVTGLSDEAWPPPPRPNPLLPLALQRASKVPHAYSEWQLEYSRRTMMLWLGAAPEVRLSWPRREGDRELNMSPLLADVAEAGRRGRTVLLWREVIHAARAAEELADFVVPMLPRGTEVKGGASFFQNQAACPFKAFAIHRLGAQPLTAASVGLDPSDRGLLVHRAAESFWKELGSSERLAAATENELRSVIERAVAAALESTRRKRPDVMSEAFAALERDRVAALLRRLAELEKQRAPFTVLVREGARPVEVAGVRVSTRLDRVDRLADGSQVILDYKTSRVVDAADWLGERPDEPQLPLYAASSRDADLAAVAFVQLHAQRVRFEGLSRTAAVLPGVPALAESGKAAPHCSNWRDLLERWRVVLENLAAEYLSGRADVAPKDYPQTCEYCELGPLCRVRELKDHGPISVEGTDDE